MKSIKRLISAGVLILIFASSCNMPTAQQPTSSLFSTPDLTLTAIFSPVAPSNTPSSQVWTATSPAQATATSAVSPATATSAPVNTATTAPLPTNTTAPQPTNTQAPLVRGGTSIRAIYLSNSPDIDGDLGEWNLTKYDVKNIVFGRENWENEVDLSGWIQVGWDEDNLYIAGHVFDDNDVQEATGEDIFKGDSFEILMDTNLSGDFYTDVLSPDDFQLGFSPGERTDGENVEAYRWYPTSVAGSITNKVDFAAAPDKDDYVFEVAIPWSVFETTSASGKHFGFCLSLSDNDTRGAEKQETMASTCSNRSLLDPTTWGDLLLVR